MTLVFWKYKVYADIRGGSSEWGRQMTMGLSSTVIFGVGWLKSTNVQFSRCYIFVSVGNNVSSTIIRSGFLLTPVRMTSNGLECPIHLTGRLADGTVELDVAVCICCGFQR